MTPDGRPHVVPFVYALVEGRDILSAYWVVDAKRKRSTRLQRLRNLEANPAAEFVVDGYEEDWRRLWWVRARGSARTVMDPAERSTALGALRAKYPPDRDVDDDVVVVAIDVEQITGWRAT